MRRPPHPRSLPIALVALAAACAAPRVSPPRAPAPLPGLDGLPTGVRLDPVGERIDLGSFPLAFALAPDPRYAVVSLGGWRRQGLQVVDRAAGRVVQTAEQPAAFLGLAFAPDGRTLYASGGYRDLVYRYAWRDGRIVLEDSLSVASPGAPAGRRFPAGLAVSPDGRFVYVAENLADSLAVLDAASGRVVARFPTGLYPYDVVVAPDGTAYVSSWAETTVAVFRPDSAGLRPDGRIVATRHPSAMTLSADGSRLFVASASTDRIAVVDTRERRVLTDLPDAAPGGPAEGSTPNALALSADGRRLFVAEADNNAIAVFDLSPATSGLGAGPGRDALAGRIPVDWYPTGVQVRGDTLLALSAKGRGSRPNPGLEQPDVARKRGVDATDYVLGQLDGTLRTLPGGAALSGAPLDSLSARVAAANRWNRPPNDRERGYPPFEHVIYVIKENRTYDQVLGDLPEGDGDASLVFFPRPVSPNHHALAERFGLFDRFFVNAEVSADGHNWSTAAYATDYVEKTIQSNQSRRRPQYDYEGTNRTWTNVPPLGEDVAEPANGYLWDLANRAGISFRNYGEFVIPEEADSTGELPPGYRGTKPFLAAHTDPDYPGWNLEISDQVRADRFLEEFREFERTGKLPALMLLRLPDDHTAGGRPGAPTPGAYMADNDLALGRIVEAISRSRFWKSTVLFVLEDDAQNGPDHVDSHRSLLLVISPYDRPGVHHRFANTTDVLATISGILGLGNLSQFDHFGRPLSDAFSDTPDLRPYAVITPDVPLDETNPPDNPGAEASRALDLRFEDRSDDDVFNRVLWSIVKGPDVPYPGATRLPAVEWRRSR